MKKGIKSFFGGIVVSLLILLGFVTVQIVVMIAAIVMKVAAFITQSGADLEAGMEYVMEIVDDPIFLSNTTVATTVVSTVIAVFFYWLLWGRKKTQEDKVYFKEKVLRWKNVLMISIAAIGMHFLAVILYQIIEMVSPSTVEEYTEMMNLALGGDELLMMITVIVLAPIAEECILRGLILKRLHKYYGVLAAVLIQAVLFGVYHMNMVQGIYVLPLGAALGFLTIMSRSVIPAIYMHAFYNLMSGLEGALPAFCQNMVFEIIMVVICTAILLLFWQAEKKKEMQKNPI